MSEASATQDYQAVCTTTAIAEAVDHHEAVNQGMRLPIKGRMYVPSVPRMGWVVSASSRPGRVQYGRVDPE